MKLQRINKYVATFVLASTILTGCSETKKVIEVEEEPFVEANFKREFNELTDEEIMYEISKLGILENESLPSECYKILEFVDTYGYHRYMVINSYVNFITDENGNLLDTTYTVKDAFSKEELFETIDYSDIIPINNYFKDSIILSVNELNSFKRIGNIYGANEEYIDNVVYNNIKNRFLTPYDVSIMYVSLIGENARVTYDTLECNKKLVK